ncbi:MAG: uncharacterized protein JWO05_3188 [Gemmatimonadetes bacterium]|nr:uncharacterized protein [Gemmatimonadota bacterium]
MHHPAGRQLSSRRWLPPLVWAGVILVLTSIPNPPIPRSLLGTDKLAHFAMYAPLAFLLVRAILPGVRVARAILLSVGIVALYGAADEWHQQFIPGRSDDIADWRADATGAVIGALAGGAMARRS